MQVGGFGTQADIVMALRPCIALLFWRCPVGGSGGQKTSRRASGGQKLCNLENCSRLQAPHRSKDVLVLSCCSNAACLLQEKPDAVLPTMGGQTALNLAKSLAEVGPQHTKQPLQLTLTKVPAALREIAPQICTCHRTIQISGHHGQHRSSGRDNLLQASWGVVVVLPLPQAILHGFLPAEPALEAKVSNE